MEFLKKSFSLPKLSRKQLISLVSLLIILLSLPLGVLLVKQSQIFQQRAVGPEARPAKVKITNLHGGGFSVSWTSVSMDDAHQFVDTTGWVEYGTAQNSLNQTAYDDRGGENVSSTTHHISLFNLNPNTTYYFKIESGPYLFGLNVAGDGWVRGGTPQQQKTPITLELSGNPNPIYGYIKKDGNKVSGALVYVQLKKDNSNTKSALMSTVTKTNEGWVMDAKNARTENLTSFFSFDSNDQVLIDVQAAQNGIALDDLALSNSSPARDIITLVPVSTPTPTPTAGPTATPTPRLTPTPTPTGRPTPTPTLKPTATPTPRPTATPTPTGTPTPIPTQAPNAANLNFQIKFQGINQQGPNKIVRILLKKGDHLTYTFESLGINASGNGVYSGRIMNITPDNYDVYLKGWNHLQKKFEGIALIEGENQIDWSGSELLTGDANNDNVINAQDVVILVQDYRPNTPPESPADFNLDGTVNAQDVRFLVENYRKEGDQ